MNSFETTSIIRKVFILDFSTLFKQYTLANEFRLAFPPKSYELLDSKSKAFNLVSVNYHL